MERKQLEDIGLEKDIIDKVIALHQSEIQPMKAELEIKKTEVEALTLSEAETKTKIDDLSKLAGTSEEIKKAFDTYKEQAEIEKSTLQTTLDKQKLNTLIDEEIVKAGGNKRIVKALINVDELMQSKDRSNDVIKAIKGLSEDEETKVLFKAQKVGTYNVGEGIDNGGEPKPKPEANIFF